MSRAALSSRDLLAAFKADPGSLTPAQLASVRRLARQLKEDAAAQQPPDPAKRTLTKEDIAAALGVHARTVQRYAGEGMPHDPGGSGRPHLFNLAECLQWLRDQGRNPLKSGDEPDRGTKAEVELKLKREKARLAELDRQEREEVLHDAKACRQRRVQQLWALKREFLALPRSIAPELEGRDRTAMEQLLEKRIVAVLERFAGGYVNAQA